MTVHLEAKKGDYADIVLLPGDPLRAKWIADTYLEEVNQVNGVRNCLGFTGYLNWNDKRILLSTQGGGMGMHFLGTRQGMLLRDQGWGFGLWG